MRTYKFEITLKEQYLEGDEFFEEAIEKDGTGITDVKQFIIDVMRDIIIYDDVDMNDVVKLTSYTEK